MSKWKSENYLLSPYNFIDEVAGDYDFGDIEIHDITLRDGEQQAGIEFTAEEKLEIARKLDNAGVQRIEAGMPIVSDEDEKAVKNIANEGLDADIYAFGRCMKRDVDNAVENDVDGIVMEIPSSDHLIEHAYDWTIEKAVNSSIEATNYAKEYGLDVVFFTVDSTRSEFDTFWNIVKQVKEKGYMDSYALIDTFGVCTPTAIAYLVEKIQGRIDVPMEIHAHNDFGLGVANSIFAAAEGAKTIHTTINGIGERCGNADTAEVVASLEMLYDVDTGIKLDKLRELAKYVEKASGVELPDQKGIVGDGVYKTESGLVTQWYQRVKEAGEEREVYPIKPEFIGHDPPEMVLGKGCGQASVLYKLDELGMKTPSEDQITDIVKKIKKRSVEKKGLLSDDEFIDIVNEVTE